MWSAIPSAQGMYSPEHEKDACGVAFVAQLSGEKSHAVVRQALDALENLEHRGASGSEPDSGDGAGILVQVPDTFFRAVMAEQGVELPPRRAYAVGIAFLPDDDEAEASAMKQIEEIAGEEGLVVIAWRDLPVDPEGVGRTARSVMPRFKQLFVGATGGHALGMALERRAYCLRKRAEHEADVYFPSLSLRTIVYKGMLTTAQVTSFFPDLSDERFESALALVHSRFSTNTFPSWPLAHPYRLIAHNGEINTVKGNRNWMRAREAQLASDLIPGDLSRLFPICTDGGSDSAGYVWSRCQIRFVRISGSQRQSSRARATSSET